ncbi:hypothetical protein E4T66_00635 [Sinimarinibacterium sp. CAU 1509]|uniref:hypothetical protein n=1 Tax=Sinimarinibacterium sp. CAU 1509 TaxID=2562283 RepID=UPI0010AD8C24|nr:hypothetical protein [Sinimarinibacterium sp. CAU 1509]TJY64785.1 hypothetical protein E4T66_00635 [Sinimarinibacterium sp. CAU 1509]
MTRLMGLMLVLLMAVQSGPTAAHGGVSVEDDVCIMRIGPYRAHFTGYQPEYRATQEFCEDIPVVAKAIIVLDFIDNVLRGMSVEFNLLRDTDGLGAAARFDQLGSMQQIRERSLFNVPAATYPRGTITLEPTLDQSGWYIGVLSATDPETGGTLHSVFPFRVGVRSYWRYGVALLVILALSVLLYRVSGRKRAGGASTTAA